MVYPLYMVVPYIRVHFINDHYVKVVADILNITQLALLFHFSGRIGFVTHMCLLMKFFGGAWYPHGISRSWPIRFEPSQ